jgi:hypothetical protein
MMDSLFRLFADRMQEDRRICVSSPKTPLDHNIRLDRALMSQDPETTFLDPQRHVSQGDQDRDLDEGTNDRRERLL